MARIYYSKDTPKYQFVDVPYVPTKELGHTPTSCRKEDYLAFTKLEVEAFISQCKRIVAQQYKKSLLVYKLETLNIEGENRRYMRIGFQPANPESVSQLLLITRPHPQRWDAEAIRYLSQRNYTWRDK
jgi:hypothetical protein